MTRLALLLVFVIAGCAAAPDQPAAPYAQDLVALGVDPASPVESRIGPIPADTAANFLRFNKTTLVPHEATAEDRRKLAAALDQLLPLQRRIVQERLRSISFAENLPANAQTSRVSCERCTAFNLVINAQVLNETVSQFTTRKERTLFDASGSTLSVSIEAGSMSALTFVLLHEATHMVDYSINLMPQVAPGFTIPDDAHTAFSRGIWEKPNRPAAPYFTPLLGSASWFSGKTMPVAQAPAFYADLKKTPFPSTYAAAGPQEDLAELVALSELTGRLRQPFRIEVRDGNRLVSSYEPMKSPLVRARLPQLARFKSPAYELPPPRPIQMMSAPRQPQ